jgi:hypothetical protein
VNGEVHGGRPRPTGAVVPRLKKILARDCRSHLSLGRTSGSEGYKGKKKGEGFINLSSFNFMLKLKDIWLQYVVKGKIKTCCRIFKILTP